jgi:FixJ family two-component response regulator
MALAEVRPITSALVVGGRAARSGRLRGLIDLLANTGVSVALVDTPQEAAARLVLTDADHAPCVFIDVGDVGEGSAPASEAEARVRAITDTVPLAEPVLVASAPPPGLVIAGHRAGAGDFIDLANETSGGLRAVLDRMAASHHDRLTQRRTVGALRSMIEDFLRDLVKTERRSIDLEHRLAQRERQAAEEIASDLDADREPTVFIVEDDRDVADTLVDSFEEAGLVTFAFLSGEDALRQADKMANRRQAIDLALVDLRLPGIDGLETVRRLRAKKPGLAAFLMTGFSDVETATSAADLGVVGFVLKPFDDLSALISRVKEQAHLAVARTREHHYLARIKERHDRVLSRYRKLAAEIDR